MNAPHDVGTPDTGLSLSRAGRWSTQLDRLATRVVLLRRGRLVFVTFGLFAGLGAALSLFGMGILLLARGVPLGTIAAMDLAAAVGIVGGSWLVGQLFDWRLLLRDPRAALARPVFVSWGGALPLPFVLAWVASRSGIDVLVLLDALARVIFLGHALGRVGCLTYGCCHGSPTRGRLSITYRSPLSKVVRVAGLGGIPLHPAPAYEAALDGVLLVLLNGVALAGAPPGVPTALALCGYGVGRFAIEFTRDNRGRMVVGPLATNHLISLGLAGLGLLVAGSLGGAAPAGLPPVGSGPAASVAAAFGPGPLLTLAAAATPAALLIFLGFSLHRGSVGRW